MPRQGRPRFTPDPLRLARVCREYQEGTCNLEDAALYLGCSMATVTRLLRERGVAIRRQGPIDPPTCRGQRTRQIEQALMGGLRPAQVARTFEVTPQWVSVVRQRLVSGGQIHA